MRLWIALLTVLPACGFSSNNSDGGGGDDVAPPDAQLCFGSMIPVCFDTPGDVPTEVVALLTSTEIDTEGAMCNQKNDRKDSYCVVAAGGAGFTIASLATVRAFGNKPLVLLSTTSFSLLGNIDVSSNNSAGLHPTGAGANPSTGCEVGTAATGNSGGGGGSLGGKGGDGEPKEGSQGGGANPKPIAVTVLHGGCRGGAGSTTAGAPAMAGSGGSGGGAIAIVAASIDIMGTINASGAGGLGGSANRSGGGGGGSGGMIVLDAPSITRQLAGTLFANGGGGGQGGAGSGSGGTAAVGHSGGESPGPGTPGAKGGGGDGGDGGDSSYGSKPNGSGAGGNSTRDGGGGAGGGGAGVVRAHGLTGDTVAPASDPP